MVTDDFVDGLTSRTDIEGGGRCDGHGSAQFERTRRGLIDHCIIDSIAARNSNCRQVLQKRKLQRDENTLAGQS